MKNDNVKLKILGTEMLGHGPSRLFTAAFVFVVLTVASFTQAQGIEEGLQNAPGIEDFTIQKVADVIVGIVCWFSGLAMVFIVLAIVWFGVNFLMSKGEPEKITQARKALLWGIVGIAVILGTYTIIATIANSLGLDYSFIPLDCPTF